MKDITIIKQAKRLRRHARVRSRVTGTEARPRLCVSRSNKSLFLQVIDDTTGKTLVSSHSKDAGKGTKTEKALALGKLLAEKAQAAGIKQIVFDRGGFLYHGRVKAVAEGAREAGLIF